MPFLHRSWGFFSSLDLVKWTKGATFAPLDMKPSAGKQL